MLTTCHRAENTDDTQRLRQIVEALARLSVHFPVVLPIHPRTRKILAESGLSERLDGVRITDPMPFMDMVALEQAAKVILTDSGGVQKEAFFYGVPCVTMRDETEWTETIAAGWNVLVGADADKIVSAVISAREGSQDVAPYGNGKASANIVRTLILASGAS